MTSRETLAGFRTLSRTAIPRPRLLPLPIQARFNVGRSICTDCLRGLRLQKRPWGHALVPSPLSRVALRRRNAHRGYAHEVKQAPGPIAEYEERVRSGRLRDDAHQRGMWHLHLPTLGQTADPISQALYKTSKTSMKCCPTTPSLPSSSPQSNPSSHHQMASSPFYETSPRKLQSRSSHLYLTPSQKACTCMATLGPGRPC